MLLLQSPQANIRNSRERKGKFESDITTIFRSTELPNRPSKPDLRHTEHGTHDTKAESEDSGHSRRELVFVQVMLWAIACKPALEDDVFG